MRYLVFDTTSNILKILYFDGVDYHSIIEDKPLTHSAALMPGIERLLGSSGLKNVDVIGVCVGPGSFTGIRIGVTTAKIFAYTGGIKAVPINSLELLAYNIYGEKNGSDILSVIDGVNMFYAAAYSSYGILYAEPRAFDKASMQRFIDSIDEDIFIVGDTGKLNLTNNFIRMQNDWILSIKRYMEQRIKNGDFTDECGIVPYYIQKSQAEKNLNGN